MSSILDALKKSEADRQRAAGPALLDLHVHPRRRGLPTWAWVLLALLVGNGALMGWLLWHRPAPVAAAAAAPATPPVAAPVAPPAAAPVATAAPPPAPAPPVATRAPATPATGAAAPAAGDPNPADDEPAVEAPRRARAGGTARAAQLPAYAALSGTLPALHMDLHFWSEVPAERYVLINLHRVGEGETLPEGPRVLEITRDGVVMEYQGREFLLGRE